MYALCVGGGESNCGVVYAPCVGRRVWVEECGWKSVGRRVWVEECGWKRVVGRVLEGQSRWGGGGLGMKPVANECVAREKI